jgi:hypothetical protein
VFGKWPLVSEKLIVQRRGAKGAENPFDMITGIPLLFFALSAERIKSPPLRSLCLCGENILINPARPGKR